MTTLIAEATPQKLAIWLEQARRTAAAWRRQVPTGSLAASMLAFEATVEELETEISKRPRAVRFVGWDGASRPIWRYTDERHLPSWMQAQPTREEIEAVR